MAETLAITSLSPSPCATAKSPISARPMSVSITPGWTELTRIRAAASSLAQPLVNSRTAPLVEL
jgi:hypothetical protein